MPDARRAARRRASRAPRAARTAGRHIPRAGDTTAPAGLRERVLHRAQRRARGTEFPSRNESSAAGACPEDGDVAHAMFVVAAILRCAAASLPCVTAWKWQRQVAMMRAILLLLLVGATSSPLSAQLGGHVNGRLEGWLAREG